VRIQRLDLSLPLTGVRSGAGRPVRGFRRWRSICPQRVLPAGRPELLAAGRTPLLTHGNDRSGSVIPGEADPEIPRVTTEVVSVEQVVMDGDERPKGISRARPQADIEIILADILDQ